MDDAKEITAVGRNKKTIKVGDAVKYVNSDTVSRIAEIKKDDQGGKVWVLLETTDLWYKEETLEYTDIKPPRKRKNKENLLPKSWKRGSGKKGKLFRPSISEKPEEEGQEANLSCLYFTLLFYSGIQCLPLNSYFFCLCELY